MRTTSWLGNHLSLVALTLLASACLTDDGPQSAFDDDGDDGVADGAGGKADSTVHGYRDGCGTPIRTGQYALAGDIVTPTGVVTGWLVIDGEKIVEVRSLDQGAPINMPIAQTNGVIYPGLIDGHGHVEYNHVPFADLGKRYQDRDQWPNASLYQTLVKDPKNAVADAGLTCEGIKHGELRALVGGTTAIQGTPALNCVKPLVRKLEQTNFCRDKVRQNVMDASGFTRSISGKPSFAQSIQSDIKAGKLDAFAVHLGEGIDTHARNEWQTIKNEGLAVSQLVVIHGAAFQPQDFVEMGQAGAKLVWSPSSNFILYGATANIPAALDAGVSVSLGSDWAPSGSANLLAELKIADKINKNLWGGKITDQQLFQMVTINGAKAFGMTNELGTIEVGKMADLLVVAKNEADPYRNLIDSRPQDVELVTISGDPLFGATDMMDTLGKKGDYEMIDACGVQRAIDVTVPTSSKVTKGDETFAQIESSLTAVQPTLTPVIDCSTTISTAAFKGTPLEGK
jgi:cytosine/adenosine deaminase-related metal-dependent hydrolase